MKKNISIGIVLLLLVYLPTLSSAADWPMFRHDAAHSGIADEVVEPPLELLWKYRTDGRIYSSPAVSGGVVYVGSEDSYVYALDASTGSLKWKYKTGSYVYSSPAISGGIIYVGSFDNQVYALDASTGSLKWKYGTSDPIGSPTVSDGVVYIGSWDSYVYALDASTGNLKWKYKTGYAVGSSPAVSGGVVYIGSWDSYVYALDANTGNLKWKYGTANPVVSSPAVSGDIVYVGSFDGYVYALNSSTGSLKWKYKTSNWIESSPAISGDIVYVGSNDSYVYAMDASTGSLKWKYKTGSDVRSSPAVSKGIVYVGSYDYYVYAIDDSTGSLKWKYRTDGIVNSPIVSGGVVYVGSGDGNIYAFAPASAPTSTPTTGTISMSSTPSGASIYLDGSYQGKTPRTIPDVSAGSHYIELKLDGYNPWSDSINVAAGGTSYVSAPLVPVTPTPTLTTLASTSERDYSTISLDSIANWPIDHLIYPPSGNITLGGVPFYVNREFQTRQRMLLNNPSQGVLNINITSPLKIYVLLNGAYVLKQFFEKEVGYIEMEFNDGYSFKKSIIAGRDLRETWAGDENLYTISSISGNPNWQNVWSESQSRGDQPATAFIDMLTIPLPQEYQSRTLTAISIYDTSIDNVGSSDPSLIIMGITVEYKPEIKGFISISSTPSGASIYLDGVYQGKTPKIITDVSVGSHYVELKLEGYKPLSDTVEVKAGGTSYISAPLILITSTATKTSLPVATTSSATPPPPKQTNWVMIGGIGALIFLVIIAITKLRTKRGEYEPEIIPNTAVSSSFPETGVTDTSKKSPSKKPESKGTLDVKSAYEYKGAKIFYKLKLENNTSETIGDIKVHLFVPDVFLLAEKEKAISMLETQESKTVTFEIRPTGECGECNVSGKIEYYDYAAKGRKMLDIENKSLSVICPVLKRKEIDMQQWEKVTDELIKAEEKIKELSAPAENLFNITSRVIKDNGMFMLKPEITSTPSLFNGLAMFYAEGVTGYRYAAYMEVVGGARKSRMILKVWAEKDEALIGFYHRILDEIEKRIDVKIFIDDAIVQQHIHYGDKIGTQVKDSVIQRSTIGTGARKCSECGKAVKANATFCPECGTEIGG
ncbi:MAG: PQQ-binding-like beta-propeller repeat protein [Euryarchaeota archaeon]|nr:PQQ-binding-like beta-propeller repeat protein [Euryarchaeota archaeon]MCG2736051.1 PQQ-binding-like beta-propeller repeat protein [Candidatus Methanoperedenaceae archaeon]